MAGQYRIPLHGTSVRLAAYQGGRTELDNHHYYQTTSRKLLMIPIMRVHVIVRNTTWTYVPKSMPIGNQGKRLGLLSMSKHVNMNILLHGSLGGNLAQIRRVIYIYIVTVGLRHGPRVTFSLAYSEP